VTDDGRFLMIQLPESDSAEVRVVQNWHEELKRLVPAR
jgi:hypothetical protein